MAHAMEEMVLAIQERADSRCSQKGPFGLRLREFVVGLFRCCASFSFKFVLRLNCTSLLYSCKKVLCRQWNPFLSRFACLCLCTVAHDSFDFKRQVMS